MSQRLPVVFTMIMIFMTVVSCKDNQECDDGSLNCQCTYWGDCADGMRCNEEDICVAVQTITGVFNPDANPCGGKVDVNTNLQWENPAIADEMSLAAAKEYCLGYGGNWRLPTIEELRTVVSDACPAIASDGIGVDAAICPITDESTSGDWNESCFSRKNNCEEARAANDSCFVKPGFTGTCTSYHWSSSIESQDSENAWVISFEHGSIFHTKLMNNTNEPKLFNVRCVCDPNPDLSTDADSSSDDTQPSDSDTLSGI